MLHCWTMSCFLGTLRQLREESDGACRVVTLSMPTMGSKVELMGKSKQYMFFYLDCLLLMTAFYPIQSWWTIKLVRSNKRQIVQKVTN